MWVFLLTVKSGKNFQKTELCGEQRGAAQCYNTWQNPQQLISALFKTIIFNDKCQQVIIFFGRVFLLVMWIDGMKTKVDTIRTRKVNKMKDVQKKCS